MAVVTLTGTQPRRYSAVTAILAHRSVTAGVTLLRMSPMLAMPDVVACGAPTMAQRLYTFRDMNATQAIEITDEQIEALRREADNACDQVMHCVCLVAQGEEFARAAEATDLDDAQAARASRFLTEWKARAECARVIAEAEAA